VGVEDPCWRMEEGSRAGGHCRVPSDQGKAMGITVMPWGRTALLRLSWFTVAAGGHGRQVPKPREHPREQPVS